MTQVIECLPTKCKTLCANLSMTMKDKFYDPPPHRNQHTREIPAYSCLLQLSSQQSNCGNSWGAQQLINGWRKKYIYKRNMKLWRKGKWMDHHTEWHKVSSKGQTVNYSTFSCIVEPRPKMMTMLIMMMMMGH
jgi:hypothetical protein